MSNANCKPSVDRSKVESQLEAKLLAIAGTKVAGLETETQIMEILSRGQLFTNHWVRLERGEEHRCHGNAAKLWAKDINKARIVTGFAMADELWIPHSWVIRGRTLIETTCRFERYFGVILEPLEAVRFWLGNVIKTEFPDLRMSAEFMKENAVPLSLLRELAP